MLRFVRCLPVLFAVAWLAGCGTTLRVKAQPVALSGATLFMVCAGCHSLDATAGHAVGPNLHGLPGRRAGSAADFAWSPALAAGGFDWTPERLAAWIMTAETMVPGTWMLYHNELGTDEVERLVAYIFTQAQ